MKNILVGSLAMFAGFAMASYGAEHYSLLDNSFNNWLFSDGGIVLAFVGVVIAGKELIKA